MKKYFWNKVASADSLLTDLAKLSLTSEQKKELMEIAHVHMHQVVLDTVLSQLNEEDKTKFLELVSTGQDEKIWEHLHSKVEKIEDTITIVAEQVKKELASDVEKVKSSP